MNICLPYLQSWSNSGPASSSLFLHRAAFRLNRVDSDRSKMAGLAELSPMILLISNCFHVLTSSGHPVTNRKRKEETNSMCSSRSYAPCCRAKAIHARWTSPPYCRELSTSCRSRKVWTCIVVCVHFFLGLTIKYRKSRVTSTLWHVYFLSFELLSWFLSFLLHSICFRHHCTERNLWCETGLEAFIPQ